MTVQYLVRTCAIAHALRAPSRIAASALLLLAIATGAQAEPLRLVDRNHNTGTILLGLDKKPSPVQRALLQYLFSFIEHSALPTVTGGTTAYSLPDYGALSFAAGGDEGGYCAGTSGVALDPSGQFAYMSGGFGSPGRLCGFVIDPVTQALTPMTLAGATPPAVPSNPHAVAIDPSGRFMYVAADIVNGSVAAFAIDRASGEPSPLPGSPFATGGTLPTPIVIDRGGRFLYVGQSVGSFDGSIAVFAIDAATGALSHIPGSPFANVVNGGRMAALALSPDGRFLFTGGSALATYSLDPTTGAPTRMTSRAGYYYGLAVDPTGRFLFGVNDSDGLLHGYAIAANGALAPAGTPQPIGAVTRAISAIKVVADLVYVGNSATGGLYGFRIDPASGALTPVAGSPLAGDPVPSVLAGSAYLPPSSRFDAGANVVASIGAFGGRPPYAWSIVAGALPPGTALDATTGIFSGRFDVPGTYAFTVQVTDGLGATVSGQRSVAVTGSGPTVSVLATVVANPYGPMVVQGATMSGTSIASFAKAPVIRLGTTPGANGSFAQIDFAGLSLASDVVLSVQAGAPNQTIWLRDTGPSPSAIAGRVRAIGGNGANAPKLYLESAQGVRIDAAGAVEGPSGLTVDTLGATVDFGGTIDNAGTLDGGPALSLLAARITGGGPYKGDALLISTFGNANNPVNGSRFLANGLQLFPGTGASVALTLNDYGAGPQFLNLKVNGDASIAMPSAWPAGSVLPPNNAPLAFGGTRAPGAGEPVFGGGSMIIQAAGDMTVVGGTAGDFVFPGAIALIATGTLNLNGTLINQGWTTTGKTFQGVFFESPRIVSPAGTIRVLANNLNWINFSTLPHAAVRAWALAPQSNGGAAYVTADGTLPHLNTYSVVSEAAANGECWICLISTQSVNMYGP